MAALFSKAGSPLKRVAACALLVLLIAGALPAVVAAVDASWNSSCNSGEVCVWKNGNFGVPLAATGSSDSNYNDGTDNYPNTQDTINDSVSAVRNLRSTDAVWFSEANYGSFLHDPYCVPAGWQTDYLGGASDIFSSHLIGASSLC